MEEKEKDVQEHPQLLLTGTDRQLHELVAGDPGCMAIVA
jgi:hypothetical protein